MSILVVMISTMFVTSFTSQNTPKTPSYIVHPMSHCEILVPSENALFADFDIAFGLIVRRNLFDRL